MAEKRVPTQFLDLSSQDFGPRQEEAGSRIQKVGKPPPTEFIQIPERVLPAAEVLAELDQEQHSFKERTRRWAKQAATICVEVWDAMREAVGAKNGHVTGRPIKLGQDEPLHLRADETSPVSLKLLRGATITIYPEIDAPAGWIAARAPGGELGYVSAERVLAEDQTETGIG